MPDEIDPNQLVELTRHYDTQLWTVTSIWAGADGALLAYSLQHFDSWLAGFGLLLTVCTMYYAFSFRRYRRRVHDHEKFPKELKALMTSRPGLRQWDVFTVVLLALVGLWARVFMIHSSEYLTLWMFLVGAAVTLVICMWVRER